jgi:hypothetical protein
MLFRNWTTVLRTSEPRETGQVAVVFGSTDQILETMQSVHRDNATAVLQWVFVPLDMSRDLGFLGTSTLLGFLVERQYLLIVFRILNLY